LKDGAAKFYPPLTLVGSFQMDAEPPMYFCLLNDSDQAGYRQLQRDLLFLTERRHRGKRLATMTECLHRIIDWARRGGSDDWRRFLVCGVCCLASGLAVNSHQIQFLTNKCKSSINGALKKLGYATISRRGDTNPELVSTLPLLHGRTPELRQWSVRRPCERETAAALHHDNDTWAGRIDECDLPFGGLLHCEEPLMTDWEPQQNPELGEFMYRDGSKGTTTIFVSPHQTGRLLFFCSTEHRNRSQARK
jgi:hypothetical protein